MSLQAGKTLSHHRIVRQIGEGGMGAVFLAEDAKLGRSVALKVLPPEMAASAGRLSRFQREARSVAALNHPHIVTLHSAEEEGGIHFLTMELVEGESLDRTLPPGGLPLARVFDVGIALADALAAADAFEKKHGAEDPASCASIRTWRGGNDAAFAWLEKAVKTKAPSLAAIRFDNVLGTLASDPRSKGLLKEIGLPAE